MIDAGNKVRLMAEVMNVGELATEPASRLMYAVASGSCTGWGCEVEIRDRHDRGPLVANGYSLLRGR